MGGIATDSPSRTKNPPEGAEAKKVFVTGATGYIGSAVCTTLLLAGHEVHGLARPAESTDKVKWAGGTPVRASLIEPEDLRDAPAAAEAAVHTASTSDGHEGAVDLAAVQAMIGALRGTNKPFVYTNGVWVMGDTGPGPADEMAAPNPTPMVAWRVSVEDLARQAAGSGVRSSVVRPAIVVGCAKGIVGRLIEHGRASGRVR